VALSQLLFFLYFTYFIFDFLLLLLLLFLYFLDCIRQCLISERCKLLPFLHGPLKYFSCKGPDADLALLQIEVGTSRQVPLCKIQKKKKNKRGEEKRREEKRREEMKSQQGRFAQLITLRIRQAVFVFTFQAACELFFDNSLVID